MSDGINGTDNVEPLFPDRPSAAPLGPQPEIVTALESIAVEAASGKITGLLMIALDAKGDIKVSISGKVPFSDAVAALEQMKFGILARDYARAVLPK